MTTIGNSAGRQEIVGRIARLSSSDRAAWGKMSVHQMICHLTDSYRIALGERTASPATGLIQRTLIKWIALWAPIRWAKVYQTRPEVEQGNGGSLPKDFERDRAELLEAVKRFCENLPPEAPPHPVFGKMSAAEWWRWGYLHADHHLRQFGR